MHSMAKKSPPDDPRLQNRNGRPYGQRLSDVWLDGEEGKLHPAEWDLLRCAVLGKECKLGTERPNLATDENRVRAEFVRFLALGGDDDHPLHEQGLWCLGAYVECMHGKLDLEGCRLPENVWLFGCTIDGDVLLRDCLGESLGFSGSSVKGINGNRCELSGDFLLRAGFNASQTVRLLGASIGGNLECKGSHFDCGGMALEFDGAQIAGTVFLDEGFQVSGSVRLIGAKIGGDLICRNCQLLGQSIALNCEGANIAGAAFLDQGFVAKGLVDFSGASIGADLLGMGGSFDGTENALHAPRVQIGGNLSLNKECTIVGPVSFQGATIAGDATFQGSSFQNTINLRNAKIDGMLVWRGVEDCAGELNLAGASCRTINMDWSAWEKPTQIRLDQFSYKGFSELPPNCDANFWKDWLERQPSHHLNERFRPNPYRQLADVLDSMGFEPESRAVRIARAKRQARFNREHLTAPPFEGALYMPGDKPRKGVSLPPPLGTVMMRGLTNFWDRINGLITDHGYRPGKALLFLFGLIIAGSIIFKIAATNGIMTPTHPLIYKEAGQSFPLACSQNWTDFPADIRDECLKGVPTEYSEFSAIIYSLDVAVPIVDFRMESDWSPRVVEPLGAFGEGRGGERYWPGWWVRTWEWVQIALGWLLSLLFASAVTGIVRR